MKKIRSLMTLAGLILAFFALSAVGAKAQALPSPILSGTFTLPVETHWGGMTLPAGDYTLRYGTAFKDGTYLVTVDGEVGGSPRGMLFPRSMGDSSGAKSALVCVREGDALVVRALEMPQIGTSAEFDMPYHARLEVKKAKHNGYTRLAEAPMLIERIPVTINAL